MATQTPLSQFLKQQRKRTGLTQEDLAYKAGVGLRFVRDLEQGKPTLRLDKVNQLLGLFNHEVGPVPIKPQANEPTR
ncbi:MAG: transcriptional regulator [Cytophagales bacterium]|nr:MAG: transcriptional regulator [Cytophagales bacterium]